MAAENLQPSFFYGGIFLKNIVFCKKRVSEDLLKGLMAGHAAAAAGQKGESSKKALEKLCAITA